ncbi:MAG TPA: DSD1 family PLP-dependent enzyme [Xanthomonadales bacterium]|nr:DSD1 family PLP-dependent enzyme [Xanthomonadales bacterium]
MLIDQLPTPCLVLDEARMDRNIARMRERLRGLGVAQRPHLKTCKNVEIARRMMATPAGPATVSTLEEATQFAAAGVRDILYAVGIAPNKLARVIALRRAGIDLSVILDSVAQAEAVVRAGRDGGERIPVLIEIDADGHRAGVRPGDPLLIAIGHALHEGGAQLRGVMTHAGGSYDRPGADAIAAAAEQERDAVVRSAAALRAAGLPCPVVSVGSTPTASFARDLSGVTEVRAGVYVFQDLVMAGLGVCALDDIAVSVLASVIGHQRDKGWILVDAGWMATSRDRGTASQAIDQGYGLVCDAGGRPWADLVVSGANQEHGIVSLRTGSRAALPELPVGALVRILPNHACATAAQHAGYHVLGPDRRSVTAWWPRFSGW